MAKRSAGPRDPNQLVNLILDMTTGDVANDSPKRPDSAIAKKAARARRRH